MANGMHRDGLEGTCARASSISFVFVVLAACSSLTAQSAEAATNDCFTVAPETDSNASAFVDPASSVCKAFQSELNASCGKEIPITRFVPRAGSRGLSEPKWAEIPLFDSNGAELNAGFSLLSQLVRSRALATYSVEREKRAERDVKAIVASVRDAKAKGSLPALQRVSIDLIGLGKPEDVYRLILGRGNPRSVAEAGFGKGEPQLFLERAARVWKEMGSAPSTGVFAGSEITNMRADIILFDEVPYLVTWSDVENVLVYAAYLEKNRLAIPDEENTEERLILPTLKCAYKLTKFR